MPSWNISIIICCLSHCAFFLTGHTNSIASVDLSNAYVGVQEYDTFLIGILTFCSNWSGSLWWSIAGWTLINGTDKLPPAEETKRKDNPHTWIAYILTQSCLFSLVLALLSIAVTILREHLFIWTVFSPKYLYQVAWTILFHWIFQTCIGSLFTQILFKWKSIPSISQEIEE